jgi:pimeloyl-ACP methyl ester carboxylesterase
MIEDTLLLKDGRRLGYGIYGKADPRDGIPVFDFHGIPGSRREAALIAEFLSRDDVCFVGFDRPGYGRSSPKHGFRIPDLPGDAAALADALGVERFIALGYSGGGPFALACACRIPERIAAAGIVSGVGPAEIGSEGMHASNRKKFNLAQRLPGLARWMLTAGFSNLRRDVRRSPQCLREQMGKIWQQMPEPDRQVLQDARFADGILAVTRDAIQETVSGWANEEILMAQPWGFRLEDVHCSTLYLWHGELDCNVPIAMGKAVAERLPGCNASFVSGEGHLSLLYNHGAEIVETLIRAAKEETTAAGTSSL